MAIIIHPMYGFTNNKKIVTSSTIISSVFIFVLEIILGVGTIVPLSHLIGFIVWVILFAFFNYYFVKKYN